MGKAQAVETKNVDGFDAIVYQRPDGGKFAAFQLATLRADLGRDVKVTGVAGAEKGTPRAAAWNLEERGSNGFLQRVLNSRIQTGRAPSGGIRYSVPGASVQVPGYDSPLAIRLEAVVDSPQDRDLALAQMEQTLIQVVARGVYSRTQSKAQNDEAEADEADEVAEIEF